MSRIDEALQRAKAAADQSAANAVSAPGPAGGQIPPSDVFRDAWSEERDVPPAFYLIGIVLIIVAPIMAAMIQMAISRQREYLADATGAMTTRHPDGLVSALEKLREYLTPHGLTTTATALSVVISANAVKAAPSGLAATISTGALEGVAISNSAGMATTKAIAMTMLQKTLMGAALTAAIANRCDRGRGFRRVSLLRMISFA